MALSALGGQEEIEVEMLVDSGHRLVHRLDCAPWVLRAAILSWWLGFLITWFPA